ncbi:MAG: DMT family transporter [Eggerthellaceae bacterium]|nr:DMT family transporter [Eggerthellaceae bacterium]
MGSIRSLASAAAILSAVFYGISVPLVKLYGEGCSSTWASSLLYFGAGLAMVVLSAGLRCAGRRDALGGAPLTRRQWPLLALMVALNAGSAIALVAGISLTDASAASLLGNLEVVATAVLAWVLFREPMGRLMVAAICAITVSGFLLSWSGEAAQFSPGSLLIVLACVLWGLENNCTRALSAYDVVSVTRIKGLCTGVVSAALALALGDQVALECVAPLVGVGVVSYGASIALYIWAQRFIGAARTGNFYSIAPFVGVALSWVVFGVDAGWQFWAALALSVAGVALTAADVARQGEG